MAASHSETSTLRTLKYPLNKNPRCWKAGVQVRRRRGERFIYKSHYNTAARNMRHVCHAEGTHLLFARCAVKRLRPRHFRPIYYPHLMHCQRMRSVCDPLARSGLSTR